MQRAACHLLAMMMVPKRRLVGVLGGMGPAATVDFLSKIVEATPAGCDQDHVPVILHGVPQIPDRSSAIEAGSDAPYLPMLAGLRMLERSGADVIAIPCNTAHYWYERLARTTPVEIIHIVDAVRAEALSRQLPGTLTLLATRGTLSTGLYQNRMKGSSFALKTPSESVQHLLDQVIAAVKAGDLAGGERLAALAADSLQKEGSETLVLACTELPVAFRSLAKNLSIIDATDALARACVRASMDAWQSPYAVAS
jgi:aspartate racemase